MTLEQCAQARKRLGTMGAVILIVFFAALLDSCVARFRAPLFTVHLLPGASERVEGQLGPDIKTLDLLRVETSHPSLQLQMQRLQHGFWLGGNMWVGTISADPGTGAGTYDLKVFAANQTPSTPAAAFRAIVYPDRAALRQSYLSVIRRLFDVAPWMVALACVPALGLVLGLIFFFSQQTQRLLAARGRAEVFLVRIVPDGVAVYFGLGRRHGVAPGMTVALLAPNGEAVGTAVVQQVALEDSMALADQRAAGLRHGAVAALGAAEGQSD